MKLLTKTGLLSLFVAVSLAGLGCKKTPKNVTPIPKGDNYGAPPVVTDVYPSQPIGQTPTYGNNQGTYNTGDTSGNTVPFNQGTTGQELVTATDPTTGATATGMTALSEIDPSLGRAIDRTLLGTATVYFDYDRFNVRSSEVDKVKEVAQFLKDNTAHDLAVEGHCDERGTEEYNRALGEKRALAVRQLLIDMGISKDRIVTRSFGEDQPAHPGNTDEAYALNRRAEFVVLLPRTQ